MYGMMIVRSVPKGDDGGGVGGNSGSEVVLILSSPVEMISFVGGTTSSGDSSCRGLQIGVLTIDLSSFPPTNISFNRLPGPVIVTPRTGDEVGGVSGDVFSTSGADCILLLLVPGDGLTVLP